MHVICIAIHGQGKIKGNSLFIGMGVILDTNTTYT